MLKTLLERIYLFCDKGSFRILCLLMSLAVAGYIFWDPELFTVTHGVFKSLWQVYFVVWVVCAGLIYGSGITAHRFIFKMILFPPLLFVVLLFTLVYVGAFLF